MGGQTTEAETLAWNVPYQRNPNFTDRDELMEDLPDSLGAGSGPTVTQPRAISGPSGRAVELTPGGDPSEDFQSVRISGSWQPLDVGIFKGREQEREAIYGLLRAGRARFISILGRGGMGKTALACKVLSELETGRWPNLDEGPEVGGVVYLSTRSSHGITLDRIYLDCTELLEAEQRYRLQAVWASRSPLAEKIARLLDALGSKLYVLLLDNLEDLIDSKGQLANPELTSFIQQIISTPGGLRLLATSRTPPRLDDAAEPYHSYVRLTDGLGDAEGVQLLRELDPNGEYGIGREPEENLIAAVRRTHGVPRALQLVLSSLRKDEFLSLNEVTTTFYSREEVVVKLVEENYGRLGHNERKVFEALAIYNRGVSPEGLQFLLKSFGPEVDVLSVLRGLVRSHVVEFDRQAKLAILHKIDQEYLYGRIPTEGPNSRPILHEIAAAFYRSQRTLVPDGSFGFDSNIHLDLLESEFAEFDQLVNAGCLEVAAELLAEFGPALAFSGSPSACREMTRRVTDKVHTDRALLGVLVCQAAIRVRFDSSPDAHSIGEQAISITRKLASPKEEAAIESILSTGSRYLGDAKGAIIHCERALELYRRCNDVTHESELLWSLSLCYSYSGDLQKALQCGKDLLTMSDANPDPSLHFWAHNSLSLAYLALGQWEDAIQHARTGLSQWSKGMSDARAYMLNTLGVAIFMTGNYPGAESTLNEGRDASRQLESPRAEAFCLYNLAVAHYLRGAIGQSINIVEEAYQLFAQTGLSGKSSSLLAILGAANSEDRREEVRSLIECTIELANEPDLFPARELAAHARSIAADINDEELVKQLEHL